MTNDPTRTLQRNRLLRDPAPDGVPGVSPRAVAGEKASLTPNVAARQVIYHSFLYYGLDQNEIKDTEFDKLCQYVADNWEQLSDDNKLKLGSAEKIRASGYHIKMSQQDLYGAAHMLGRPILIPPNHFHSFAKKEGHLMPVSVRCFLR